VINIAILIVVVAVAGLSRAFKRDCAPHTIDFQEIKRKVVTLLVYMLLAVAVLYAIWSEI
jgi:hypothetical protein